jgi:hypothetical protein
MSLEFDDVFPDTRNGLPGNYTFWDIHAALRRRGYRVTYDQIVEAWRTLRARPETAALVKPISAPKRKAYEFSPVAARRIAEHVTTRRRATDAAPATAAYTEEYQLARDTQLLRRAANIEFMLLALCQHWGVDLSKKSSAKNGAKSHPKPAKSGD